MICAINYLKESCLYEKYQTPFTVSNIFIYRAQYGECGEGGWGPLKLILKKLLIAAVVDESFKRIRNAFKGEKNNEAASQGQVQSIRFREIALASTVIFLSIVVGQSLFEKTSNNIYRIAIVTIQEYVTRTALSPFLLQQNASIYLGNVEAILFEVVDKMVDAVCCQYGLHPILTNFALFAAKQVSLRIFPDTPCPVPDILRPVPDILRPVPDTPRPVPDAPPPVPEDPVEYLGTLFEEPPELDERAKIIEFLEIFNSKNRVKI